MQTQLRSQFLVASFLVVVGLSPARGDLLLTGRGRGHEPAVLRYNEVTGTFITNFTKGRFDEEMEGGTFGPDGNLYVTVNNLGSGAVLRYHGSTGAFLNKFVPFDSGGLSIPYALKFKNGGDLFVGSIFFEYGSTQYYPGRILRYDGANGAFRQTFVANGAGGLSCPFDIVFGPDGNLYVADGVYTITSGGLGVLRYHGSSGSSLGTFVPKGSGGLTNAAGLLFGSDGNLYVSSFSTDSVLRYNGTNGAFIDAFVAAGSGGLDGPQGLTFGPDGRLYVCSALNHAVMRYDGKTGAFVDVFVAPGSGGLSSGPSYINFTPRGPRLTIARSASNLLLSWPRTATDFVLDVCQMLSHSNNWTPVSTNGAMIGEDFVVTNSPTGGREFFRLRRQCLPPSITVQPTNQAVGGSNAAFVTFHVTATGTEPLSYQWLLNQTNALLNATDSSLILGNIHLLDAGSYSVLVSNACGSVLSSNAELLVTGPPEIIAQPKNLTVIAGSYAIFNLEAFATGDSPLTYQWRLNDNDLTGETNSSLTIDNVQSANAGHYSVRVRNSAGEVISGTATLTVLIRPVITAQPQSRTNIVGTSATFSVTALGAEPLTYQWVFNGTNALSNATNASLTITNIRLFNAGVYSVLVTDVVGWVTSSNAELTVIIPPTITAQPTNLTLIVGSTARFTVEATGTPRLSFQWIFNGRDLPGETKSNLTISNVQTNHAGNYVAVVTNVAGAATSAVATLTVTVPIPPLITQQPSSVEVTQGQNVTFTVVATGDSPLTYQWRLNGSNIANAISPTQTVISAQSSNAGNYDVIVSNNSGSVTSAVAMLTVLVPPTITNQPENLTVLAGSSASFSVSATGTEPLFYQWRFDGINLSNANRSNYTVINAQPADAGLYSVLISNVAGAVLSSNAQLRVNVPPTITAQPTNLTVIADSNAIFNVTATGTPPLSYQWFFNETNRLSDATNSTLTVINAQTLNAGLYRVLLSNAAGSVTSSNATLTVIGDSDGDGLLDAWEMQYFGNMLQVPNDDPDWDGRTNLQEFQEGTDPNDYYNGALPSLSILSGNSQTAVPTSILPQPLVVQLKTQSGANLTNAPITFAVSQGDGELSVATNGVPAFSNLMARSDASGQAAVYYRLSPNLSLSNRVTATAKVGTNVLQIVFDARSVPDSNLLARITMPQPATGEMVSIAAFNTNGTFVGSFTSNGLQRAFSMQSGMLTDLGTLGGQWGDAKAVNRFGHVVGSSSGTNRMDHATLWKKGSITDLQTLPANGSYASGINNSDQVVGYFQGTGTNYGVSAFLWQNGSMSALKTLGGTYATAQAINNAGQIVGVSYTAAYTAGGVLHAALWQNNQINDLGSLGGSSEARDINEAGRIVGASYLDSPSTSQHAVTWLNGVMTDLGSFDGMRYCSASSINNLDQAVGYAGSNERSLAFLWTTALGKMDLQRFLPADSEWTLTGASRINDAAEILASATRGGVSHTVVLTLPPDSDHDGIPDAWEMQLGLDPNNPADASQNADGDALSNVKEVMLGTNPYKADTDGDGVSDSSEVSGGTDPLDFFNGTIPLIHIVSGNYQSGPKSAFLPKALTVKVTNAAGTPVGNATVIFKIALGNGQLVESGILLSPVSVLTTSNGIASIPFRLPADNFPNIVQVCTGKDGCGAQVSFLLKTDSTPGPVVIDLGTLGGTNSFAYGLNDSGEVVGVSKTLQGEDHGFRWSKGSMTDLGTLGGTKSAAFGINNSGEVVGNSTHTNSEQHAFRWKNGVMTDINGGGSPVVYEAAAISHDGKIAGTITTTNSISHACIQQNGAITDLGTLGDSYSTAKGINSQGEVIGYSVLSAFLWRNGTMLDLAVGGYSAWVAGINRSTQIVGSRTIGTETRAFIWQEGRTTDLKTPQGASARAYGINDAGQIVGGFGANEGRGFIYQNGSMVNLNDLVQPTMGWLLTEARAINNTGMLVGTGKIRGETHGFFMVLDPTANPSPLPPSSNDLDGDGIPDDWELAYGLDPHDPSDSWKDSDGDELINIQEFYLGTNPMATDTDHDGLSDYQEYLLGTDPSRVDTDGDGVADSVEVGQGTDPIDYYNGVLPRLTIVGGNNQRGAASAFLAQPLAVRVLDLSGAPLSNAPVTFIVVIGSGRFAVSNGAPTSASIITRTDGDGNALIAFQLPSSTSTASYIAARASSGTNSVQAIFMEAVGSPGQAVVVDLGRNNQYSGVNSAGQVVGTMASGPTQPHAIIWQNAAVKDLGVLGTFRSAGNAIDNFGRVVGSSYPSNGPEHACLWQNGTINDLGSLSPGASYAYGINQSTQVVGYAQSTNGYYDRAVRWQNGVMTDLGLLGSYYGFGTSRAYGINDAGQIAGVSSTADGDDHAALWQGSQITDLGTLAGSGQSSARAINQRGQIVGMSRSTNGMNHATLWFNGAKTDLGSLGSSSEAHSINNSGQVVGSSYLADYTRHAFIWKDGVMNDLNSLLPPDSGWVLNDAVSISDGGYVVGTGLLNGAYGYYLLILNLPDADGDAMPDEWEIANGFNPNAPSDAALDPDSDGLTNLQEYRNGTDPRKADGDGDGMPDGWEVSHGLDPTNADDAADLDGDGLTNLREFQLVTDPGKADTDGDGMSDGWEVRYGLNPKISSDASGDFDGDGLTNLQEYQLGADPTKADTDGDGLTDLQEKNLGTSPSKVDTDGDGLSDLNETQIGTDPKKPDTDDDSMPDGWEGANGLNPLVNDALADRDGDDVLNYRDAKPNDASVGELRIQIFNPPNGATIR